MMMRHAVFAVALSFLLIRCEGGSKVDNEYMQLPSVQDVPASAWEGLEKRTIYFGHQSVGFNIMDGVEKVLEKNPFIKLRVVDSDDPSDLQKGVFAHSKIGENNKPVTKIEGMQRFMKREGANQVDIAFSHPVTPAPPHLRTASPPRASPPSPCLG